MTGYVGSIEKATLNNPFFRQVLFTGKHSPTGPLRLYTIYAPPNHPDGTIHHTKAEAEAAEGAG
jgi:hypothetical protein